MKLQLDYQTNITQTDQKIELYGSLTTKDLKKPHSSRQVGGAESQSWGGDDTVQCGEVAVAVKRAVQYPRLVDKSGKIPQE